MTGERTERTWIELTQATLDVGAVDDFLRDPACGAVSLFVGTTRRYTDGRETEELAYDAYAPMAIQEIQRLVDEARDEFGIERVAVLHRLGVVPVAQASVIIGVATPHRAASFAACRYVIDTLKTDVPIWKREHFADGTTEWVEGNLPGPADP